MTDDRDFLTEDEATRLWQRAAQLQADEARRAEARAASEGDGAHGHPGDPKRDGYALIHVRAAAVEAGIGEEFVEAALAEVQADRLLRKASGPRKRPIARWIVGNPEESISDRRVIRASTTEVLSAMEALFPHEPFLLTLRERLGDPAQGGTLVFDIQGAGFSSAALPGFRGEMSYADARQVYVTLVPLPGEPSSTEVSVRAPIAWAFGVNAAVGGAMITVAGGFATLATGGIASVIGVLGPVASALVVATGGGLGAAAALAGFRAIYRYGRGRGAKGLNGLLAAVAAKAEGGWGIAPTPPTGGRATA